MVKKPHPRIWNKRNGKMMPPKILKTQQGPKGEIETSSPSCNVTFFSKLRKQIKKNIS